MLVKKDIQAFSGGRRALLRAKDYIYLPPHPALRGVISNYTVTFPNRGIISDAYTVIPHGCATLVLAQDERGLYGNLFGPMTQPCKVGGLANQYAMLLIIEFQPAGLFAFTGVRQQELADLTVPFGALNLKLHRLLLEALESAQSLEDLLGRLDGRLLEHLSGPCPAGLRLAMDMLIQSAGNVSCKDLAASVYYSERHLHRLFETYLGTRAKTLARLIRINKAIRLLQDPRRSAACASLEAGFYDAPHFFHDFKSVCGTTPQAFRDNMSDFYSEIAKF